MIARKVFLHKSLKRFCTTPLKNNSSTTAGISAKTKLTFISPKNESLVSNRLLSFSETACICLKISSPEKWRLLFSIWRKSFKGMLTIGIIIAQIIHLLFLIVEKLVLKSFKKSAIHTQLDKPNIHIEPIACMHKAPALVWLNIGNKYLNKDINNDVKDIAVIKNAIDIKIFTIGDKSFVSNFIDWYLFLYPRRESNPQCQNRNLMFYPIELRRLVL